MWAASNLETGQDLALKFLRPELTAEAQTHQRLLREARAAAAVRHRNVVAVHEVLENEGCPVIVMDLLRGITLAQRLSACGALSLEDTAGILAPVVSAIGTAHARGVVHRDLKPDNVFICAGIGNISERVRVLDFGIAKLLERDPGFASTQTGTLVGSPLYMSPEQVFCERDIDHRTDAWSLGVIIYECLSGVRPTKASSVGQTLKIITTGTIRPLSLCVPGLPTEIADLVDALLNRDRFKRPDLALVRERLKQFAPEDDSPAFGQPAKSQRTSYGSVSSDMLDSNRQWRDPSDDAQTLSKRHPTPDTSGTLYRVSGQRTPTIVSRSPRWLVWVALGFFGVAVAAAIGVVRRQPAEVILPGGSKPMVSNANAPIAAELKSPLQAVVQTDAGVTEHFPSAAISVVKPSIALSRSPRAQGGSSGSPPASSVRGVATGTQSAMPRPRGALVESPPF